MVNSEIESVLLTQEQIQSRLEELGRELTEEYEGKNPVFVGILKGVVVFFSDMIRHIPISCQIDFMSVSSYSGSQSTGKVVFRKDLDVNIEGRHVVILEDILDTGRTLKSTVEVLKSRNPASLKIVTFLDKKERRVVDLEADYVGFRIPDEFVVGYGLDYDERFRNLPYVGILSRSVYEG